MNHVHRYIRCTVEVSDS